MRESHLLSGRHHLCTWRLGVAFRGGTVLPWSPWHPGRPSWVRRGPRPLCRGLIPAATACAAWRGIPRRRGRPATAHALCRLHTLPKAAAVTDGPGERTSHPKNKNRSARLSPQGEPWAALPGSRVIVCIVLKKISCGHFLNF
uniref:Uncharacterized protein n=1 Tax=Molossus molossus TaxID=27622 RepID=A0A7J8CSC9_MOLMO|nr:hypothetical protein HJG59_009826 [Molossus molossus]